MHKAHLQQCEFHPPRQHFLSYQFSSTIENNTVDHVTDISAHPHSVNVLDGVDEDVRTPDKLIDGVNDTSDGAHMWLAPIIPNMVRRSHILQCLFDRGHVLEVQICKWKQKLRRCFVIRSRQLRRIYLGVIPRVF